MRKYFTLTELIVSVIVVSILALIVLLNITDLTKSGKETAASANLREIQVTVDRYYLDHDLYPTDIQPSKLNPQKVNYDLLVPKYIKKRPKQDFWVEDNGTVISKEEDNEKVTTCEEAIRLGYICITNEDEFNDIRNNVTGKYILMNDIDLSKFTNWEPIGDSVTPFDGVLNGNTHTVSNMTIADFQNLEVVNYERKAGLFGQVTAGTFEHLTLTNFHIDNVDTTNTMDATNIGGLIGRVDSNGINNPDNTPLIIENVNVDVNADVNELSQYTLTTGALIGTIFTNSDLTIKNITTNLSSVSGYADAGGLFGKLEVSDGLKAPNIHLEGLILNNFMKSLFAGNSKSGGIFTSAEFYSTGGSFTLKNVQVTSDIESGNAAGAMKYLEATHTDTSFIFENIKVRGNINGEGISSGFGEDMYLRGDSILRDIDILANVKTTQGNAYGFAYSIDATGKSLTVEDITIDGVIESTNETIGFINYAEVFEMPKPVKFNNITIKSTLLSPEYIYGFAYYIQAYLNQETLSVSNILITSDMTSNSVFGFSDYLMVESNQGDVSLSNIQITGDLNGIDPFMDTFGLFNYIEVEMQNDSGNIILENIHLSGNINSAHSNVYPFISNENFWIYYEGQDSLDITTTPKVIIQNNSITGQITAQNGDIYQSITHK